MIKGLKWFALAVLTVVFSLIGLSAMRLVLSLVDQVATWFGYHFAYWHALGSSPLDGPILAAWFSSLLWMGLISWITVWCFGDKPIHWLTVLLLCVVTTGVCWFMASHGALGHWLGIAFALALIGFTLMIVAKLLGFNRFGRWLGEKGSWWWKNVLVPWIQVPIVGFFLWWLPLVLLWWLLPTWHATLLNDTVPWIVQWIFRPVALLLLEVILELVHVIRA
jgi:hypothetical protein